mmetsp:Transcript_24898/g.80191  ORF Transcript_24898/g.80191 Transcript_24898/m.80191 type:complete len:315 (+) Transcript_24898:218-1162(+)
MILACEKSISGCSFMNRSRTSCFFISSLVGRPIIFWRWSNIIFSTVLRVSGSRSPRLEFSGSTLVVSISGSPSITPFHHSMPCSLNSSSTTARPWAVSSSVHIESSALIRLCSLPSTNGACPLRPTFSVVGVMATTMSRERVPGGTSTFTVTSDSVCVHTYVSVRPPLSTGACPLACSSPSAAASASVAGASAAVATDSAAPLAAAVLGLPTGLPSSSSSSTVRLGAGAGGASAAAAFSAASRFLRAAFSRSRRSLSCRSFFFADSRSAMACSRRSTFRTARSAAPSPPPEKKSVFRRKNEKKVSNRGSIPRVC